ncbi:MAG: hypothetical protein AAGA48_35735 [Myxococcota bacterium]
MLRTLLVLAPLALTACYKTEITNFSPESTPGKEVRVWSHAVIVGLIPLTEVDVRKECGPKGAHHVSTRQNFWNLLLAGLTSGIYTPTVAKITCNQ